jgi:mitotic spindle assembly checkpoint protein MAD2B
MVIKDKKGLALERYIFSINQMMELEPYDRDQKSVPTLV